MAIGRSYYLVDISGAASLAAANALIAAGVATLAGLSFFPESVDVAPAVVLPTGRKTCLAMQASKAPLQDWIGVTDSAVYLLEMGGYASVAAAQAAIDALIVTEDAAGRALRSGRQLSVAIAGRTHDVVALVFTDGAPAVS